MITIQADFTELSRYLESVSRKQLPFVMAQSTTKLAQLAQAEIRAKLPRLFTVRSAWVQNGIRIDRAEKRDWPAISAVVGAVDWFMESQVTGEDRTPHGGNKSLSVPGPGVRPTPETKTPRSKWPGALLKKGGGKRKAFTRRITGGLRKGKLAVLRRDTSDRYPLQVLYVFEQKTRGKKRVPMEEIVRMVVSDQHASVFLGSLQRALQPKGQRK